MKFIDEALITVESGKGGAGAVHFRREAFIPRGGPDGGNGGTGGDVLVVVDQGLNTLYHFRHQTRFKALDGVPGGKNLCSGKGGESLTIKVPPGTLIYNQESGELLGDLTIQGAELLLLKGGRGGKGNAHFKSSTHRAPKFSQPGEEGKKLTLRLELQLLADVGLIGRPNAGKSTLLSRISSARPKIADYPFTTLTPQVGVAEREEENCVIADIPGLIEGAHEGKGLGIQFLRHIRRTRRLYHLIDIGDGTHYDLMDRFHQINFELKAFDSNLVDKPQTMVLTKIDTVGGNSIIEIMSRQFREKGYEVIPISAVTGKGLDILFKSLFRKEAS
ncbi:MAG TPA: GTPase ObgE [Bdellovibrionota bacterium]|nr:GTPase ObgE [Bdellovibrionota bacterium]